MMLEAISREFLILVATVDPVGTLTLFVALTARIPPADRPRLAIRSVLIGGGVLVAFLLVGQIVLSAIGVGLASFAVSGGIVLFLFGLQMIFGNAASNAAEPGRDMAVFPLAMPSIASPGAILAVVVLTDNEIKSAASQVTTLFVLFAVLGLTLGCMLLANRIHALIGDTGSNVLVRIMGLILCALAAELALDGLFEVWSEYQVGGLAG